MHDRSGTETLKVLVVTKDRVLQRQLSQFFDLVGYQYLQAADGASAIAAVAAASPQILLVDADLAAAADWELCGQLAHRSAAAAPFKILLVEEPDECHLHDALEAGIDDFLVRPISYGELLARLRAAARVLEFDRRVGQQGRVDSLTGLLSLSAFTGHLRRQLTPHAGTSPRVACLVLDVDFFSRVKRLYGNSAADQLSQALAQELNRLRVGSEIIGCLGADRFCVNFPGATEDTAAQWAEGAREALAATAFRLGDATVKLTVSFGVAACETAERAEQLID
ncbi:MAG: diguanylate cyclase, partial [Pirellulales bacterium]